MYCAIGELLLDGVRYQPGQIVNLAGVDSRTIARLVEQRRIVIHSVPASTSNPEPKRK